MDSRHARSPSLVRAPGLWSLKRPGGLLTASCLICGPPLHPHCRYCCSIASNHVPPCCMRQVCGPCSVQTACGPYTAAGIECLPPRMHGGAVRAGLLHKIIATITDIKLAYISLTLTSRRNRRALSMAYPPQGVIMSRALLDVLPLAQVGSSFIIIEPSSSCSVLKSFGVASPPALPFPAPFRQGTR